MHRLASILGLEATRCSARPWSSACSRWRSTRGGSMEEWREREIEGRRPACSRWSSARGRGRSGGRGKWRGAARPSLQAEFGLMEMEEWRSYAWAGSTPAEFAGSSNCSSSALSTVKESMAWYASSVSVAELLVCVCGEMLL
jgi:hypothetical protein